MRAALCLLPLLISACAGPSTVEARHWGAASAARIGTDSGGPEDGRWVHLEGEVWLLDHDTLVDVLGAPNGDGELWIGTASAEVRDAIRAAGAAAGDSAVPLGPVAVENGGAGRLEAVDQLAYVRDFDVEITSWKYIADPVVDVLVTGLVLDLRPELTAGGSSVWLKADLEISRELQPIEVLTAPLDLDGSDGPGEPVSIQLPVVRTAGLETHRSLAGGEALLLGGLALGDKGKLAVVLVAARECEPPPAEDR